MAEEEHNGIPKSKISRAAKIIGTGAKVGGNYLKYFAKKTVNPDLDKEALHAANAQDIYSSLSKLKGSALKVAQMISMDNFVLPAAYQEQFARAQYSAPPLSFPLVQKTFREAFGKSPGEIFDSFSRSAVHAASIGQVHRATLGDKQLAVKVQYPGVADSISSDLKMIKPLAAQMMQIKSADLNVYMEEVESKLLEETNYLLELKNGTEIGEACARIPNLNFPVYYPEYTTKRILTMDWLEGEMLPDFLKKNPDQELRNRIGQTLWDFFLFQIAELKRVHADPHPGNFLVNDKGELGVLDFGCVKVIPNDFFDNYFLLTDPEIQKDEARLIPIYEKLEMLKPNDSEANRKKLMPIFGEMIGTLSLPFHSASFDFSDSDYFEKIYHLSESIARDKEIKAMNAARGSKHAIYIMRTFYGLFGLLHQLKATVNIRQELLPLNFVRK